MSDRFTIAPYTFNEIGRNQRSIAVKVVGFWSQDPISIYVQRSWSEKVEWKFSLSVSSGGRDPKVVASDAEAYTNYGEAIVAAAAAIRDLEANVDQIEAGYQEYRAELAEEQARQRAEIQAVIDADEPLGEQRAKALVQQLVDRQISQVAVYARGQDTPRPLNAVLRAKLKMYFCGGIISRAELTKMMSNASARTHVII